MSLVSPWAKGRFDHLATVALCRRRLSGLCLNLAAGGIEVKLSFEEGVELRDGVVAGWQVVER